MNTLYLTNNIVESIHGKLDFYLPKKITDPRSFIRSLNNIFINDAINNDNIIRYDYKSQSIINLIENENLNNDYKWIYYDTFKKYLKLAINKDVICENECNKIIKTIEDDSMEDVVNDKIESELNNDENKEQNSENSDGEIKENIIEKNISEDIENFIKVFNLLDIEKTNEDNTIASNYKKTEITEDYINKDFLNPLSVRVKKKLGEKKSNLNENNVKKKPILYPKKCHKRKKEYSDSDSISGDKNSKSKSKSKRKKKGWLSKNIK